MIKFCVIWRHACLNIQFAIRISCISVRCGLLCVVWVCALLVSHVTILFFRFDGCFAFSPLLWFVRCAHSLCSLFSKLEKIKALLCSTHPSDYCLAVKLCQKSKTIAFDEWWVTVQSWNDVDVHKHDAMKSTKAPLATRLCTFAVSNFCGWVACNLKLESKRKWDVVTAIHIYSQKPYMYICISNWKLPSRWSDNVDVERPRKLAMAFDLWKIYINSTSWREWECKS